MYVSVNVDVLQFMHKHISVGVVCDLCTIEANDAHVLITPYEGVYFLRDLTDAELRILYRNTTGGECHLNGNALRAVLEDLASRLPTTECNAFEVDRQAQYCEQLDDHTGARYVRNASRPAIESYLPLLTCTPNENEAQIAAAGAQRTRTKPLPPVTVTVATEHPTTPRPAPAQRAPSAPRSGGVRDTIWTVADDLWEKEGKPTDKGVVLALRRRIMDVLEADYQVKRTSSSNELGQWQKARIVV